MRPPTATMDAAAVQAVRYHERTGEGPLVLHTDGIGTPVRPHTLRGMMDRGLAEYFDQGRDHAGNRRGVHVLTAKGVQRAYYVRTDKQAAPEPAAPTGEPLRGQVIAHQGHGVGHAPEHATDPTALRAVRALAQAGLLLATIPETYDSETSTATGYMVVPRGEDEYGQAWVYVYYLTRGRTHDPDTDRHPRARLDQAVKVLREQGWAVDPSPMACARAHTVPPTPPVPQHDRSGVTEVACRVNERFQP